ncbi:MAG: dTMP kinase [Bacteroidales bacterium]|nr:dTMP kinase [Candidatus Cacconaster merdequi]
MLIVLEGLDGAGKSTQLKMVADYMASCGKTVEYLHFPRYTAPIYGDLISKFLRGDYGSVNQVHPQLVALLFAEDRNDAAGIIRKWLEEGRCVILDRYVYSNIAFQCAKLSSKQEAEELREWILDVEYGKFGIPKPDINLFLDVPISFVDAKLKSSRQDDSDREYLHGKNDIHESSIDLQVRVRNQYLEQCGMDKDFIRIDCNSQDGTILPPETIFSRIRTILEQF